MKCDRCGKESSDRIELIVASVTFRKPDGKETDRLSVCTACMQEWIDLEQG